MNTNSNTYTVIYSIILVVVVAAVLAFAAMFLKPTQEANVKKDTISQILTAATVQGEDILATYQQEIEAAILVDINGNKVGELSIENCEVYDNAQLKKQTIASEKALPVYIFKNGITVIPCYGAGLWGPIWGYIGLEGDLQTIKAVCFGHKGETPGLGAKIADEPSFAAGFAGKQVGSGDILFEVAKPAIERLRTTVLTQFQVRQSLARLSARHSTSGSASTRTILQTAEHAAHSLAQSSLSVTSSSRVLNLLT